LGRTHLKSYADHVHRQGTAFTVRPIRTWGSGAVRSRVLLTTLLDRRRYKWLYLFILYCQRWRSERPSGRG